VPTPGLLTISSGTPDFPTPKHVVEAAKKALDDGHTQYTPWAGLIELREAIAKKLERDNGIKANPEHEIMVTAGSQEAMLVTCQALLNPGDEVLIHAPYYDEYNRDTKLTGATLVPVITYEKDNYAIDPVALEQQITPRTKMLIIVSPSNPTGAVQTRATLEKIAELAKKRNLIVISDELYEKLIL
jgi:aspartate/methionine/tyrosine aminotransferase